MIVTALYVGVGPVPPSRWQLPLPLPNTRFPIWRMQKISTVAIITDDMFFWEAASYFLAQQHHVVLELGQEEHEIWAQLLNQCPDFVILHAGCGSVQGACVLRCIHEHELPIQTVAYTSDPDVHPGSRHICLSRTDGLYAMLRCVTVREDAQLAGVAVPPISAPTLIPALPDPLAALTPQEFKVLAMIGSGLSSIQIADRLFVSKHTIKNHKTNITRKLSVASARSLLAVALKQRNHPKINSILSICDK